MYVCKNCCMYCREYDINSRMWIRFCTNTIATWDMYNILNHEIARKYNQKYFPSISTRVYALTRFWCVYEFRKNAVQLTVLEGTPVHHSIIEWIFHRVFLLTWRQYQWITFPFPQVASVLCKHTGFPRLRIIIRIYLCRFTISHISILTFMLHCQKNVEKNLWHFFNTTL